MLILSKKKESLVRTAGYIFLTIVLIGFTFSATGRYVNTVALDSLRTKEVSSNAAVIAIDDATLRALGAWPLERSVYANLIEKLNSYNINGLVFDILFLEDKTGDDLVRSALKSSQYPVILGGKKVESGFLHTVFQGESSVVEGFVNVSPDRDGKVRNFMSPENYSDGCARPLSLAAALFREEGELCITSEGGRFLYPSNIPTFSLVDILEGKVSNELLEGKMLFVGATTLDLEDYFVGIDGAKIPGVFVHTAMYSSYTSGLFTRSFGKEAESLLIILLVVVGASFVRYVKKPIKQVFFVTVITGVLFVVSVIAFDFSYELPLLSLLVSFFASFVLSVLFHYASSRKENMFIRTMFSRYVNKEVLHELLENHPRVQTGEKREITVLFSDLRGFTNFSETFDPENLLKLLNYYFTSMVSEVFKENGTVDKFIGDAVMAFWNAPLPIHNHEYHAVRAAIGMQEALKRFNQEHGTDLKMGIGIHTGPAIVGNVGGKERASYTAFGDTVNTTSRIEGVTKKYGVEIILSGEVKDKVELAISGDSWRTRKLDEVRLRGKSKATLLFELTRDPQEKIETYEKALELYQRKSFKEALALLKEEVLENDPPSLLLIDRMGSFSSGDDFDGVWVFDEK